MATNGSRILLRRALVADIGGTNARFAIADLGTLQLSSPASFSLCGVSVAADSRGGLPGRYL
ncbi:MAG: hypothetical protein WAN86_01450 [Hyphomicrobiaceae bacterium]